MSRDTRETLPVSSPDNNSPSRVGRADLLWSFSHCLDRTSCRLAVTETGRNRHGPGCSVIEIPPPLKARQGLDDAFLPAER